MRKRAILILESSPDIRGLLHHALANYEVESTAVRFCAETACRTLHYEVAIVDVGRSAARLESLEFIRELRASNPQQWIIAISGEIDRELPMICYSAGADGFVSKAGSFISQLRCLVARFLARAQTADERIDGMRLPKESFKFGGADIEPQDMTIGFGTGERRHLNPKEVGILSVLAEHPGQLVRRTEILNYVWGPGVDPASKSLDTYLVRIRSVYREGGVDFKGLLKVKPKVGWWVA